MEFQPTRHSFAADLPPTRGYQQEMLEESLRKNIIIAQDTGSGKTHIAVLRMKYECEREHKKLSWFLAPTVSLCKQQRSVIATALPVSVGLISGSDEPNQWTDPRLWRTVLSTHRIMVSTPQVLLDALRHGYIDMGKDISLLVFDEAHHAVDNNPYNQIMKEFYFQIPHRSSGGTAAFPSQTQPDSKGERVRPRTLGLTASPVYGGNVSAAFHNLEANLDCSIRAPRLHRDELTSYVHRPTLKHVLYTPPDYLLRPFSRNLSALESVVANLNIENDPYVKSLRSQLANLSPGPERTRLDQRLSKTILKGDSYTHKGLADFTRAASEICHDVGPWAADWYIEKVIGQAIVAANPHEKGFTPWKDKEKAYLTGILARVSVTPVSYDPQDIVIGASLKVKALVECLEKEKEDVEAHNEAYNGLVFVTRRDTVLALTEVITHHPRTADLFSVGCLLGSSESAYRTSFLDITRKLSRKSHEDTLEDFKIGEKNLIVSTSVAEEGIDIQSCGSVIRWDVPANMVSWAQSRGRARRKRSTFTVMFENGGAYEKEVLRWEILEQEMVNLYNNTERAHFGRKLEDSILVEEDDEDDDAIIFRVESTGALLTLHSAVPHLNHFCAVIPSSSHIPHVPIYDIDPPDLPEGWHSFHDRSPGTIPTYTGPFASTVTLPRILPPHLRVFSTERKYKTKMSAHRHAAFKAYYTLYQHGLLNEHLLPLTDDVEGLDEEVKGLLTSIGKRAGTVGVSFQMDPWAPTEGSTVWWSSELVIDGLPILWMFTRSRPMPLAREDGPTLYRPDREPLKVEWRPREDLVVNESVIERAQHYTRDLFWSLSGSRMKWDNVDFAYLFLPIEDVDKPQWDARRAWLTALNSELGRPNADSLLANAGAFGTHFSFPTDLSLIRNGPASAKISHFLRWEFNPISPQDEQQIRDAYYSRYPDLEITFPLLVVLVAPRRTNFLLPLPSQPVAPVKQQEVLLLPRLSTVALFSKVETEYAFLLPSTIRFLSMAMTAQSLRDTLFANTPLTTIPLDLLTMAITAPTSQEQCNYQRLETLGDTVLKFIVGVQISAEYPHWHEGYLTMKKDRSVSNVRLAKEALSKGLYRWIIRNRLAIKKWKPDYLSTVVTDVVIDENQHPNPSKNKQELSTKVLADVVEALIGAAYLHGSFDLGIECARLFGLNIAWQTLPERVATMLSRVEHFDQYPPQITDVEVMLGYEFERKLLLVEALTHASYYQDMSTISYERMEFLGDSVLDMVVTDILYRAPGKKYSPGHIHLRKSAVVNSHFLAYICLRCVRDVETSMPKRGERGKFDLATETQQIHLWQCLLHSSHRILDDHCNTFARYKRDKMDIESALQSGSMFPWAALTRLQAPKFFSDMIESLIGAVYLDSRGNFDVVCGLLKTLGIIQILERIIKDDVDVLHPVSRLSLWGSRHDKEIKYHFEKEKGRVTCVILVDGKEEVRVGELYRGRASQEEVKFTAAELAVKNFKLRDGYNIPRKKRKVLSTAK